MQKEFDKFKGFFESAEFKVLVGSFVDENCVIFATEFSFENKQERLKVY